MLSFGSFCRGGAGGFAERRMDGGSRSAGAICVAIYLGALRVE